MLCLRWSKSERRGSATAKRNSRTEGPPTLAYSTASDYSYDGRGGSAVDANAAARPELRSRNGSGGQAAELDLSWRRRGRGSATKDLTVRGQPASSGLLGRFQYVAVQSQATYDYLSRPSRGSIRCWLARPDQSLPVGRLRQSRTRPGQYSFRRWNRRPVRADRRPHI